MARLARQAECKRRDTLTRKSLKAAEDVDVDGILLNSVHIFMFEVLTEEYLAYIVCMHDIHTWLRGGM